MNPIKFGLAVFIGSVAGLLATAVVIAVLYAPA